MIVIIKLPEVMRRTGKRRSSIYSAIAKGRFPRQVLISARSVGWVETEIDSWIQQRLEERDDCHQLRACDARLQPSGGGKADPLPASNFESSSAAPTYSHMIVERSAFL